MYMYSEACTHTLHVYHLVTVVFTRIYICHYQLKCSMYIMLPTAFLSFSKYGISSSISALCWRRNEQHMKCNLASHATTSYTVMHMYMYIHTMSRIFESHNGIHKETVLILHMASMCHQISKQTIFNLSKIISYAHLYRVPICQ